MATEPGAGPDGRALLPRGTLLDDSEEGPFELGDGRPVVTLSDAPTFSDEDSPRRTAPPPPSTAALGWLDERADRGEKRTRRLEIAVGLVAGVVIGLGLGEVALAVVLFLLWRTVG